MEDRSRVQFQNHHPNITKQQQPQPQPQPPPPQWQQHYRTSMNKSSSRSLESAVNTESPTFHSPARSDPGDPTESPPYSSPAGSPENPSAIVTVAEKFTQCSPSLRPAPPRDNHNLARMGAGQAKKDGSSTVGEEEEGKSPAVTTILRRSKGRDTMKRAALWSRVLEAVLCMSSFAVMAADRTQGWSGDSFDRYREYRFCLSVNIIAFAYSSFQAYNLAYHLITGKHVIRHHLRCHVDFFLDQVLSYLLLAAASAAATRVTDWVTNWGKDEFTEMARASIAFAFLGFVAFSFSSLLSAQSLWTRDFT